MKAKYLIVTILFSFVSCQNYENVEEVIDHFSVYSTYLDVNADLEGKNHSDFTLEEEAIYLEARNRFDKIVTYRDGQFVIGEQKAVDLNISEKLYQHFYELVQTTNNDLKYYSNKVLEGVDNLVIVKQRVKTRTEDSSGGIDAFIVHWYGFDVFLSVQTLAKIGAGASGVSIVCGLIPDPTLATKVAGAACGLGSVLASLAITLYPNGIIISFTSPFLGLCIPYKITSQ